jgi:hypothetical protein
VSEMTTMPAMLAYTIRSPIKTGGTPFIRVGQGSSAQVVQPSKPQDNTFWFVVLDANKPASMVWDLSTDNNTAVPDKLDTYMNDPGYLFAVVTQVLSNPWVPQGDLYDYLAAHGAGRELQKLEQTSSHTQTGYGLYSLVSYILTGHCGQPVSDAYEVSSVTDAALLLMSLMPLPNGQPPYTICDSYTFVH